MSRKSLFGISLSIDREWAWCPERTGGEIHEITARLGNPDPAEPSTPPSPYYSSASLAPNGRPNVVVLRTPRRGFRFCYADGAEFTIDATGSEIHAWWPSSLTLDDALVYLHGPILGFALRLRGVTCLHASAVVVGDHVVAVVGGAGMGKSTTAAVFARQGYAVQTDDILALSDRGSSFWVQPGLPRVLLWPESAEALWGDPAALPRIVPTWPKLFLDLNQPGYRFSSEPLPLGAIYVLGERQDPGSRTVIERIGGTRALMQLVENSYANHLLDAAMRAVEFQTLGRLVPQTPIRLVRAPDSRAAILGVCEAVLADFHSLALHRPS